jgi:hypothetical protein
MSWIAAGIAGGTAIFKGVEGLEQKGAANRIDKANPYPAYQIPQEYQDNVNQAQQMAQQGLPQQQYNNQLNSINQNQSAATSALSNSANPGANLASIVRAGDNATGSLNAQDAMARNRNMLNLLQERQTLAQQKDKAWDWNYQQRYLGNLAKSQALRTSGNANINGALNDVTSGATTMMKLQAGSDDTSWQQPDANLNNAAMTGQGYAMNGIQNTEQNFNPALLGQ